MGLVGVKDDHHYDWFRERVIFPIHNIKGKIIAFGARAMGEAQPKYLNSPETTWFNKRFELYGLHQAMQTRERTLLVTEGYMDVIKLWQHGVKKRRCRPRHRHWRQPYQPTEKARGESLFLLRWRHRRTKSSTQGAGSRLQPA